MEPSYHRRGQQAVIGRLYSRGLLPRLARQCHPSEESKWEMEDVRRFHGPKQILPEG